MLFVFIHKLQIILSYNDENEKKVFLYISRKICYLLIYNKCLPVGFDGATVWTVVFTVEKEVVDKGETTSPSGC